MKKPVTYEQLRQETLRDFESALHYLKFALCENDLAHFMRAFGDVVKAQGGPTKFASRTKLSLRCIHDVMKNKDMRADRIFEVVRALGHQLAIFEKRHA